MIAATNAPDANHEVYEEALRQNILCNAVDDPPNCDFYFGSVVARGDLQIAISTAGESPALAQRLRREIDAQLPADLGAWLGELGGLRREVRAATPPGEPRNLLLHELAQRPLCSSPACPTRQFAQEQIRNMQKVRGARMTASQPSTVYLVGAGPGDPELLTLKAVRLLATADVVLHDDLVPAAVLAHAERAIVINVGKRCGRKNISQEQINAMMIDYARRGFSVIRLKSGDPLVFGRAGEEMDALRAGGILFEVVPGITAAFAAAAALRRPLTDRRSASSISFSSGHHAAGSKLPPASLSGATRVVYMPGRDLAASPQNCAAKAWERSTLRHRLPRGPARAANRANDARAARAHPCPSRAVYPAGRRNAAGRANRRVEKIAGYALADAESRPDSLEF